MHLMINTIAWAVYVISDMAIKWSDAFLVDELKSPRALESVWPPVPKKSPKNISWLE